MNRYTEDVPKKIWRATVPSETNPTKVIHENFFRLKQIPVGKLSFTSIGPLQKRSASKDDTTFTARFDQTGFCSKSM